MTETQLMENVRAFMRGFESRYGRAKVEFRHTLETVSGEVVTVGILEGKCVSIFATKSSAPDSYAITERVIFDNPLPEEGLTKRGWRLAFRTCVTGKAHDWSGHQFAMAMVSVHTGPDMPRASAAPFHGLN